MTNTANTASEKVVIYRGWYLRRRTVGGRHTYQVSHRRDLGWSATATGAIKAAQTASWVW